MKSQSQHRFFILFFSAILLICGLIACTKVAEDTPIAPNGLTYTPNLLSLVQGNAGNSTSPTIKGTTPITYSLTSSPASSAISIDNNGVISTQNTLAVGTYQLSVKATNSTGSVNFPNVYKIEVSEPITKASNLVYTPNSLETFAGKAVSSLKPSISGTQPMSFALTTNPASNGTISISNDGIITASDKTAVGVYSISVTATNTAGSVSFGQVFTLTVKQVAEVPSGLTYTPNSMTVNQGTVATSSVPTIKGTQPMTYSLSSTPANNGTISISKDGIITASDKTAVGVYSISVVATNEAGTANFNQIFTLTVKQVAEIPSGLSYNPNSMTLTVGSSASSAVPSIKGTLPVSFSATTSPTNNGNITINSSGVIMASAQLSLGTYKVSVSVSNVGGTINFADVYTVTVNPSTTNNTIPAVYSKIYGATSITSDGTYLTIKTNGTPDHKSPYYPTNHALYEAYSGTTFGGNTFKKNPNSIATQTFTFKIPLNPKVATNHAATSLGAIGFALNGVALFNQYAGPNNQALTDEVMSFDKYYGHPTGTSMYHYHVEPLYLTTVKSTKSGLMGFLLDGFPVYGPQEENGNTVISSQLDAYHGHTHATVDFPDGIYHYHFTADAPYLNGNGYYGTPGTVTQ